jgi:hypothetical protein
VSGAGRIRSRKGNTFHAIWGSSANDGDGGEIIHWDGTRWATVPSGTRYDLLAIWGSSASDVWVCGGVETGGPPRPRSGSYRGIRDNGGGSVWVVGSGGEILHRQPR